jgi:hypothetical protein
MTIPSLYNKVKALDTDAIIEQSIVETKETIADLNAEQLFTGKRSDGSEILPSYSDRTIAIKEQKGQPTDRVTLRDTGSFYQGIRVEVEGARIVINSTDEKNESLNKKYSTAKGNIFGLSIPFKREYLNEKLRPTFKNKISQATGLIMK